LRLAEVMGRDPRIGDEVADGHDEFVAKPRSAPIAPYNARVLTTNQPHA